MTNPFESIEARLSRIESLLLDRNTPKEKYTVKDPGRLTFDEGLDFLSLHGYSVSRGHLYNLCSAGEVPSSRIRGRVVFSPKELLSWLETIETKKVSSRDRMSKKLADSASRREN